MARDGYWSWPEGGRYEGIPASNFAGWFLTGLGVFAIWSVLDPDDDPARDGRARSPCTCGPGWARVRQRGALEAPVTAAGGLTSMGFFAVPPFGRGFPAQPVRRERGDAGEHALLAGPGSQTPPAPAGPRGVGLGQYQGSGSHEPTSRIQVAPPSS
jgi:hypothetical protein